MEDYKSTVLAYEVKFLTDKKFLLPKASMILAKYHDDPLSWRERNHLAGSSL